MRTYSLPSCQVMPVLPSRGHTVNERTKGVAPAQPQARILLFEDAGLMGQTFVVFQDKLKIVTSVLPLPVLKTLYNPLGWLPLLCPTHQLKR